MTSLRTAPGLRGTFGMVVSTHPLASAAAMAVLERGGTAFDAAAAAGFTLEVVEPHRDGPAADLALLLSDSRGGQVHVICGQGPAPASATPRAFSGLGLDMIPGSGLLPACVPGAAGAWLLLLERFGTWRLRDVLDYAIGYAAGGYPVADDAAATIAGVADLFRSEWISSAQVYLPGGRPPAAGARFSNPTLAATYQRLLAEAEAGGGGREAELARARRAWYEGFVAEQIDAFCAGPAVLDMTGRRHAGLLQGSDLAAWHPTMEPSVWLDYGDWRVHKTGPWGQGPVFLQQLALLSGFSLRDLDPAGAELAHLVVESAKLAMADREAWYGDPGFTPDLTGELLDRRYTEQRRALIGDAASRQMRPGSPGGRTPRLPVPSGPPSEALIAAALGHHAPPSPPPGNTSHLDVADRWGNMVAATPSGGWLQSSPVIPGLGFALGTRLQSAAVQEGLANTVAPGKRPRTTLSPSLAFRDGRPALAFGTPGGDQQDQWSLTFFVRLAATGQDPQQILGLPMWHTDSFPHSFFGHYWHPGLVVTEESLGPAVIGELERRGHNIQVTPAWQLGRVCAAGHDQAAGLLCAAADPRGTFAAGR